MSDLSVAFPSIRCAVEAKHKDYINRFGQSLNIVSGELALSMTRVLAKMKLLSQAFFEAGVIDEPEEMIVSSRDGTYPMSLKIGKKGHPICLYLLNTGKDIIVSDSVGLALTEGTMDTHIILVTDTKRVCRRFYDVLNGDFDWNGMAMSLLESVHETVYDMHEAIMNDLTREFR